MAAALGWTRLAVGAHTRGPGLLLVEEIWMGVPPGGDGELEVPAFDTDWAAGGPLIQRFHIEVYAGATLAAQASAGWESRPKVWFAKSNFDGWGDAFPYKTPWEDAPFAWYGCATPLEVACELICNAHEAGVLPTA